MVTSFADVIGTNENRVRTNSIPSHIGTVYLTLQQTADGAQGQTRFSGVWMACHLRKRVKMQQGQSWQNDVGVAQEKCARVISFLLVSSHRFGLVYIPPGKMLFVHKG